MPKEISIIEGKNIALIGFESLAETELEKVKEVMQTWLPKLERKVTFNELRIRLKQHARANYFIHELEANLFIARTTLGAKTTNKNLFFITKYISK